MKNLIVAIMMVSGIAQAEIKDNFELAKPVYVEVKIQKNHSYLNVSEVNCKAVGTSDESFQNKTQCFSNLKTCGARLMLKQLKYRCSAVVAKDGQEIDLGVIIPTESGFEVQQNDKAADELVRFGKSKSIETEW